LREAAVSLAPAIATFGAAVGDPVNAGGALALLALGFIVRVVSVAVRIRAPQFE